MDVVAVGHGKLVLVRLIGLFALLEVAEAVEVVGVGKDRWVLLDVRGGDRKVRVGREVQTIGQRDRLANDTVEGNCQERVSSRHDGEDIYASR